MKIKIWEKDLTLIAYVTTLFAVAIALDIAWNQEVQEEKKAQESILRIGKRPINEIPRLNVKTRAS